MGSQKTIDFEISFIVILLGILSLITVGYLLRFNNTPILIWISIFIITLSLIPLFKNTRIKLSKFELFVYLLFLLISLFSFYYHHETFLDSRDESVYTNSAIFLANNDKIYLDDILIKSFYGFETTSQFGSISQFLPGYITFLALFIKLFSIKGIYVANALLFFLSLILLFRIKNLLISEKKFNYSNTLLFIIFSFNFLFIWFFRRTVSENLAFIIIWSIFYFLLKINEEKKIKLYEIPPIIILFLSFLLTRPEFSLFFSSFILSLIFIFRSELKERVKSKFQITILIITAIIVSFTTLILLLKIPVYRILFEAFFRNLFSLFNPNASYFGKYSLIFIFQAMNLFFPIMFFISLWGFFVFVREKQQTIDLLLIFFSPIIIIMVVHGITPDFPWFFRRFYWHLLPISFFFFILLFNNLKKSNKLIVGSAFIISIILISSPILFYSDAKGSQEMILNISNQQPTNSLTLVMSERIFSPNSVDGGLHNLAAPIYFLGSKKSAITNRLIPLINGSENLKEYPDIFIITSNNNLSDISNITNISNLDYIGTTYYEIPILDSTCEIYLPLILPSENQNKSFLYSDIKKYCFISPPSKIGTIKLNNSIYRAFTSNSI